MKTQLEQEAEELFPINKGGGSMEMLSRYQLNNSLKQEGFIAGTNSKYVQAEKIKAQIEVLNKAKELNIEILIKGLQQKLKDL